MIGMKNRYTCEVCGKSIVTIDRDEGVTPFYLSCMFCKKGFSRSSFYQIDQNVKPDYEWYKPTKLEIMVLPKDLKDHVEHGGLIIRKIKS